MIKGQRCLVTGGAGTIGSTIADQLVAADAAEVVVLDNLVRGRRENLAGALASGKVRLVEGDIRDRELVPELMAGIDLVFHQAAIRITQCAKEPRLALEVLVDGTYEVVEAAADAGVRKVVAASSASVYGLAGGVPHHRGAPPLRQRHSLRGGQDLQRGAAAQLPRHARARYVALRYFNVYGPRMDIHGLYTEVLIRWMERIEAGQPPLILGDGLQTMDFVYTEDIARANLLAAAGDVTDEVFNIGSGTETSLRELARRCSRSWAATWSPSSARRASVNGVTRRLADVSLAARAPRLEGRGRPGGGPARLVAWWRGQRARRQRAVTIPVDAALARRGRGAAAAAAVAPAGSRRGPGWREFEDAFAAALGARARGRRLVLHDGAAPRAGRRRDRPGRRGRGPVAVVHRDRELPPATSGRSRSSPTSTPMTLNLTPDTIEPRA